MRQRRPRGRPLDGWLIIDKPPGMTSTDVVNRVRRAFDAQKAGHGGTLDPLATGAAADRVRRRHQDRALRHGRHQAVPLHPALRRSARHRRRRRRRSPRPAPSAPTDDADRAPPCRPSAATSCRSRRSSPPSRSPASAPTTWRARAAPPVLEPRPARVDRFELIDRPDADHGGVRGASGKGVYMRSLARDLAPACGTRRPYRRPAPPAGRPLHRSAGDSAGQTARGGRYRARFPGPAASGRDRAGRHPGAGPDRSGGRATYRTARRSAWSR